MLVDLEASTPIKPTTLARLTIQGVTGLLFIDLSQATADMRGVNPEVPSERYPVIRSVASDLDLFLSGQIEKRVAPKTLSQQPVADGSKPGGVAGDFGHIVR